MKKLSFVTSLGLLALLGWGVVWFTMVRPERLRKKAAAAEARARKDAEKKARRPAQSVVARTGLPTLQRKMAAHEPVTIAFLGGSITQNAGAGGFVTMIPQWIETHAEGTKVTTINAGLAATGSDLGAKRVERDVLVHHPDVVIVEFAVNDASRESIADMDRVVRRIRLANPQIDILFIYTVMDWSLPNLERGSFPTSVKQHEQVAAHYGIPTVALGYAAAEKIRTGEWTWRNFSPDSCHPTAEGYTSYNQDLETALPALLAASHARTSQLPASLAVGSIDYPAPVKAEPFPTPLPMTTSAGTKAEETWELPEFGTHWIVEPAFPGGAQSAWRLYFRPLNGEPIVGAQNDPRSIWQPARWFEEERSFTGSTAHPVARSRSDVGNLFGASPTDAAALTWQAPTAGTYLFRIAHRGVEGAAGGTATSTRLRILHFPSKGVPQELEFDALPHGPTDDLILEKTLALSAGDQVAMTFHATGYKYAAFKGFRVTIGRFAPEKQPQ